MAVASNRKSLEAVLLSVCAALPFVIALAPDLLQEFHSFYLMLFVGVALVVAALVRAGAAIDAKRSADETPWLAYLAVGISLIPLLASPFLLARSIS